MNNIFLKASEDTGLPIDIVVRTYRAYWYFIRESIKELPLKEDLSEEEFSKLRTNFNIPSLGKLSCTFDRFGKVKDKFNNIKKLKKRYEKVD